MSGDDVLLGLGLVLVLAVAALVAIFATVVLYGLTAVPVARRMSRELEGGAEIAAELGRAGAITLYFVDVQGTRRPVRSGSRPPRSGSAAQT